MRNLILVLGVLIYLANIAQGQVNDSVYRTGYGGTVDYTYKGGKTAYQNMVIRVKRVYPYVLEAQKLYQQYEKETAELEKKSKIRKYGKQQNKILKDEFTYAFKNMSRRDGVVMMKLIQHTTGESTYSIIRKYRGKSYADAVHSFGKIFDQDFKTSLNPDKDYVLLKVYQDIQEGKLQMPTEAKKMTKEEHKLKKKKARKKRKEFRKKVRKQKKENRRKKKASGENQ